MIPISLLILAYVLTKILLPLSLSLMAGMGLQAQNYRGQFLPTPAGLVPAMVFLLVTTFGIYWLNIKNGWLILSLVFTISLLGLWDDLKGESQYKGFKGHLNALSTGKITTGLIKAIGGLSLAFISAWTFHDHRLIDLLVNTLLIALMTNFFNLMDLRPGRATKVFITGTASLLLAVPHAVPPWLMIALGAALAYLPSDLQSKSMLGDTGANFWGFVLGLALSVSLPITINGILILILLGVHLYAERYSISQLIEKTPWLSYLDRLGRPDY